MTTTFDSFTASSQVFVPQGLNGPQQYFAAQSFTSEMQRADSFSSQASGCFYNNNMPAPQQHQQPIQANPQLNYGSNTEFVPMPHPNQCSHGHGHPTFQPTPAMYPSGQMPEFKMNFNQQKRAGLSHQMSLQESRG